MCLQLPLLLSLSSQLLLLTRALRACTALRCAACGDCAQFNLLDSIRQANCVHVFKMHLKPSFYHLDSTSIQTVFISIFNSWVSTKSTWFCSPLTFPTNICCTHASDTWQPSLMPKHAVGPACRCHLFASPRLTSKTLTLRLKGLMSYKPTSRFMYVWTIIFSLNSPIGSC